MEIETTNDVAKKATEADLMKFWQFIEPTVGNRRASIFLSTPVPGAVAWGVIVHDKRDGKWNVEVIKNERGVDAEPDCFMAEIDKSKKNQEKMILTLPVVNRIVEKLMQRGWELKTREVNELEIGNYLPAQVLQVTLWPDEIHLNSLGTDELAFTDTLMVLVDELGISDELKRKLQSVVGGPEFLRAAPGKPAKSEWRIDDYYVQYSHYPRMDDLKINDANAVAKAKAQQEKERK